MAREMQEGSAVMILLALLEEWVRHGYELAKLIESQSQSHLQFHVAGAATRAGVRRGAVGRRIGGVSLASGELGDWDKLACAIEAGWEYIEGKSAQGEPGFDVEYRVALGSFVGRGPPPSG